MATTAPRARTRADTSAARLPTSIVLLPAFLALLLVTGVVGQESRSLAVALTVGVVLLLSWRTTTIGAVLVAMMAWLFLDGFIWHPEGTLGLPTLRDALSVVVLAGAALSASLLARRGRLSP